MRPQDALKEVAALHDKDTVVDIGPRENDPVLDLPLFLRRGRRRGAILHRRGRPAAFSHQGEKVGLEDVAEAEAVADYVSSVAGQ